jgi:predicted peroxiredoxin
MTTVNALDGSTGRDHRPPSIAGGPGQHRRRGSSDTGAGLYACKASVDLFGLEKNDFIPQVQDIITVGEFYDKAAGGHIIFT